jgi:hypothetical protein
MMDISAFATKPTSNLVIKDPGTMQDTDVVFVVHGQFSDKYVSALVELTKRIGARPEPDKWDAQFFADITESWSGLTEGGKPVEFSNEKAAQFYASTPWLRQQVKYRILMVADFLDSDTPS